MSYSLYLSVNFGPSRGGLSTVGYTPTGGTRITAGVAELVANTGIYAATVTFPDAFSGTILWDTGQGASTVYVDENINVMPANIIQVLDATPTVYDPLATAVPGAYTPGQAGYVLGGHVALAGTQSFNNTGQTAPLPANLTQINGSTFTLAPKVPATLASTDVTGNLPAKLSSDGLDNIPITAPTGVAGTFREMLVATWRRFYKKSTMTGTQLKTYADDGTTVLSTQAVSDDGTTQTQGVSS